MKRSKWAIVTGGTQGLGRELSLILASRGYAVTALYKSNHAAAAEWIQLMGAKGLKGEAMAVDVTQPLPSELVESAAGKEILIVHGAVPPFAPAPFQTLEWEEFDRQLTVAVRGFYQVVHSLLRPLIAEKGTVVAVLSKILGRNPMPKGFCAYVSAKAALHGMTQALGAEYAERGLRVLSVSPGFMATPLTSGWDEKIQSAARAASDGRGPAEVARTIVDKILDSKIPARGEDYPV